MTGLDFVQGVQIAETEVQGWQAWMLLDLAANGSRRPIAFLDEDALVRIHEQSGAALHRLREDRGESCG